MNSMLPEMLNISVPRFPFFNGLLRAPRPPHLFYSLIVQLVPTTTTTTPCLFAGIICGLLAKPLVMKSKPLLA